MAISGVGMANLPFWNCLPMGISNYGGDTQIYNVPDYVNTNPFIGLNQLALNSIDVSFFANPFTVPNSPIPTNLAETLVNATWPTIMNNLAQSNINSVAATIQTTKTKLNSLLETEGISNEDKKKVKDLLARLDEQEKKLNDLQNAENLSKDEVYNRSKEIEKAMRDIAAETAQLKISPSKTSESQGTNDETTASEQDAELAELLGRLQALLEQNQATQNGETVEESQGFFVDPKYAKQRAELEEQMQDAIDAQTGGVRSVVDIAQQFRDAIEGWGTDDETFNNICSQINKDNVMDLMLAYNQLQSTEHGESFMEAFMWDADHGQKAKYGKQIANALRDKALELGVYDQCKDDFAKIYSELDSWFISNDISENFDNIVEVLANAMGKPEYARPYKNNNQN